MSSGANSAVKYSDRVWQRLRDPRYHITECDFTPRQLIRMRNLGMIPEFIRISRQTKLTLAEAVWLKLVMEMMRYGFDVEHIRYFLGNLMSRYYFAKPNESLRELEERANAGKGVYGIDHIIHLAFAEEQDVQFQFAWGFEMAVLSGLEQRGHISSISCLSISLTKAVKEVMGTYSFPMPKTRWRSISEAEEKAVASIRNPRFSEVMIRKIDATDRKNWDLFETENGVAPVEDLQRMQHEAMLGHGSFKTTGMNTPKKAFYERTFRHRF